MNVALLRFGQLARQHARRVRAVRGEFVSALHELLDEEWIAPAGAGIRRNGDGQAVPRQQIENAENTDPVAVVAPGVGPIIRNESAERIAETRIAHRAFGRQQLPILEIEKDASRRAVRRPASGSASRSGSGSKAIERMIHARETSVTRRSRALGRRRSGSSAATCVSTAARWCAM